MYITSSRYGWKPDLPDHRDFMFRASEPIVRQLPSKVDLRGLFPEVFDQGQLGSCTGNAIAASFQFELMKQNAPVFIPSRLFIYYNERAIEDTIKTDSGAQIRDGFKSIGNMGVCPETMWPYVISEFAQKPYAICYDNAKNHMALSYQRVVRDINQMKGCLADGYPFVFGFTVYEGFESTQVAQTGKVNLPESNEKVVGGHAVVAAGYDDEQNCLFVRNSWGDKWGMSGYFTMPYEYLINENLSDDFWTLRSVS